MVSSHTVNTGDLVHLVSSSHAATLYPLATLSLLSFALIFILIPHSRIGTMNLLVVNPYV